MLELVNDARFRVYDHESVLLLQEVGEVLVLNQSAGFLVSQLKNAKQNGEVLTSTELVDRLCAEYAIDKATAKVDVDELVAALREVGALKANDT